MPPQTLLRTLQNGEFNIHGWRRADHRVGAGDAVPAWQMNQDRVQIRLRRPPLQRASGHLLPVEAENNVHALNVLYAT
jgi:hypothetical protein